MFYFHLKDCVIRRQMEKNIFWYKGPSKHSCKLTIFVTDCLEYMEI